MKNLVIGIVVLMNAAIIFFGLKNLAARDTLLSRANTLETSLQEKTRALEDAVRSREELQKRFNDIETLKNEVETELKDKKLEAAELARELAKEKQKRKILERKLKKAEKRISSLKSEIDRDRDKTKSMEERLERMATRLEKQDSDKQQLLSRLDGVIKERDALKQQIKNFEKQSPRYSLAEITVSEQKQYAGLVLNVNRKFGFCIVSIGKDDGIVPGIELVVHRGSKLIGKIVVERVFDRMSSAKVVSVSENENIQVEDHVRKF